MDAKFEIKRRVEWIKKLLETTGAKGIIYGNSGGKDCTLVGALCSLATDNIVGVIMPCKSTQNYGSDRDDALRSGKHFNIKQIEIDLSKTKDSMVDVLAPYLENSVSKKAGEMASININPRLRMTTLYALGQSMGYLVAGTGNACESVMGYFTKYGDGGVDFNPIADLRVCEIYDLLRELGAPSTIIEKAPSAGLYLGQTDEMEMGITYNEIDAYLNNEPVSEKSREIIERAKRVSKHKHRMPVLFGEALD